MNRREQIKNRFDSRFWFCRAIIISGLSMVEIFIAIFATECSCIGCFSSVIFCVGLLILTCSIWALNCCDWKWLKNWKNSKNIAYRCLYGFLYHYSTAITAVFAVVAFIPIVSECPYQINVIIALSWGVLYTIDLFFFQLRWTYRKLPSAFISLSFLIMYALFISTSLGKQVFFGYEQMDESLNAVFISNDITKWLGWGIIASILTTFISKATEDTWHGVSRSATGDYEKSNYRFKKQRRKLLTYQGGRTTRIERIQIILLCVIPVVGVLVLFQKEGNTQRLLLQLYFIGVSVAIVGFILHQFITDENLLRSEYKYIVDRRQAAEDSWENLALPCSDSAWEWTTYCQVMTNIYCSRSPIFHENELHHGIRLLLPESIIGKETVCPTRFVADLIQMFEEQYELYCSREVTVEQREIELQFADNIVQYINETVNENTVTQWSDNTFVLEVVKQIFDVYFDVIDGAFQVNGVPFENVKKLIEFDFLKRIVDERASMEEKRTCRMSWWCQSPKENARWNQAESIRRLLPYLAAQQLRERWGERLIPKRISTIEQMFKDIADTYEKKWAPSVNYWAILEGADYAGLEEMVSKLRLQHESTAKTRNKGTRNKRWDLFYAYTYRKNASALPRKSGREQRQLL